MGSLSIWHWLIVGAIVLIVFGGKGKVSDIMGDFAKGIKAFKKGLAEDDETASKPAANEPPRTLDQTAAAAPVQDSAADSRKVS